MTRYDFTGSTRKTRRRSKSILFGLNQSPFLLGGTLEQHLSSQEKEFPTEVAEIRDGMYVDDLLTGGCVVEEVNVRREQKFYSLPRR